jgi:hypothetical protein
MCTPGRHRPLLIGLTIILLLSALPPPLRTVAEPTCPDPYEPNDGFAKAWPLSPGMVSSFTCTPNDPDCFSFPAHAGSTIRLDLSKLPANYDICLYDPSQTIMACSTEQGTRAEAIEEIASSTGKHFACSQVQNIGAGIAAAWHVASLGLGGNVVDISLVDVAPGGRRPAQPLLQAHLDLQLARERNDRLRRRSRLRPGKR